ncbi:MAG: Cell division protein [Parcubacteria group bacterium GW2011_GWC2_40_31]|nr:MAG: Cell division protein [Parcubacteria group bacterium GW2011_GWA2_40_143]KKR60488.1 MAG: Cell division protein [Parcubacteria group bacterium GW2011_GWC2_40_31]KKR82356.1 MAG: Cell division protein [Parcubacteria group bacterium GW2011_GWD2_40_9]
MSFWRNGWVSLASILVVVITLFTIGSLVFFKGGLDALVAQLKDKVDITVYFKPEAQEQDIMTIKTAVSKLSETKDVAYVDREQALESFKERNKNNALLMQSLDELGENPLGASLNIKAKEISQYESIANFLNSHMNSGASDYIDKINYFENKRVIERLSVLTDSAQRFGVIISLVLAGVAILVTFNTIRLTIYSSREEIEVMRLVGASNKFASGPFIVEGVMYGVVSAIITMIMFFPVTMWLGALTENFLSGMNVYNYYIQNFGQIFVILLIIGVLICSVSSFIAIRRYLRV